MWKSGEGVGVCVLGWGKCCSSKLKPLYTAFFHIKKVFGYKMGIKFDNDPWPLLIA